MAYFLQLITKTFTLNIGKFQIEPTYWQAVTIVFLIFLLLMTFARVRYLYVHWSLGPNSLAFLFWGFVMALIFEGFMIIGGRTLLTEILGIKNVPKPISTVIEIGRAKFSNTLNESTQPVPDSLAQENPNWEKVFASYQNLPPDDSKRVQEIICR